MLRPMSFLSVAGRVPGVSSLVSVLAVVALVASSGCAVPCTAENHCHVVDNAPVCDAGFSPANPSNPYDQSCGKPCNADNHCHVTGGTLLCDAGFTFADRADPLDFSCVSVSPPDPNAPTHPVIDDGTPALTSCTNTLGGSLDTNRGRLDGFLTSVVLPSNHNCNGDSSHVHLQVRMNTQIYDVAVNVQSDQAPISDVGFLVHDGPLVGVDWAEGWHIGAPLDYASDLHVHSTAFVSTPKADLVAQIQDLVSDTNHISVFMLGYGPQGGHDVHRAFTAHDGAIVVHPTSATPRYLLFRFAEQSF
jgi:hypothetical protein